MAIKAKSNSARVGILTLGCKVNQYESEAMAEELTRRGFLATDAGEVCDAYIINTCTVTAEAARKSRQMIRRLRSRSPEARIVVTGCLAQTTPAELAKLAGVDSVIGNAKKLAAVDEIERLLGEGVKDGPTTSRTDAPTLDGCAFEPMRIASFARTRVYLKIEDGCENRCSYCIIPDARGPVRSKPQREVLSEISGLIGGGAREIVVTGIEVASYGRDLGNTDLGSLLCDIDALPEVRAKDVRIRLGSLEPSLMRPDFIERIAALGSLAPHFHISLQSGCSRTLAAMRRKYNAERAMRVMEDLRAAIPGVQFTCDVIAGFPGESETDHAETLDFMRRARFLAAHVFPYSKRDGTPAATMPDQVPEDVKHRRAAEISALSGEIRREILSEAAAAAPACRVLFESFQNGHAVGHTDSFIEVRVPSAEDLHGRRITVRLLGVETDPRFEYGSVCTGEIVK